MSELVDDGIGREVHEAVEPAESGRPDKPYTALSEIRQLVEGFYDIQHLRVETYNRIVAYIRQNSADIIVFLRGRSQSINDTQRPIASQSISETQTVCASQDVNETQSMDASHSDTETHTKKASLADSETQPIGASHPPNETHLAAASQNPTETLEGSASHTAIETQIICAISFLEGKEYSKFVDMMLAASASDAPSGKPRRGRKPKSQYTNETQRTGASQPANETQASFVSQNINETHTGAASQRMIETPKKAASHPPIENQIGHASQIISETQSEHASQQSDETHNKVVSHGEFETHCQTASHNTCETHLTTARQPVNVPFAELIKPITSEIDNLLWFYNHMLRVEIELGKRLDLWSMHHPLRVNFLSRVYGIGGIFSSGIIAWLDEPILKSDYVSSIWRYCGLTPDSKRIAGKKTDYDVKLKSFCWKISTSFIKFDCFGRELYLQFKRDVKHKHPVPVQAKDERGNLLFYRKSGEPRMLWTPKHLDMYARRKTVKMFLSAVWETWRRMNGRPVETIYPVAHLGHKHHIPPEKWMEKPSKELV
jgi:hypothetical protein